MSLRIPLRHYPWINPFVLDWMAGDTRFLPRGPRTAAGPRAIDPALVTALKASNRQWGLFVDEPLDRWAAGKAVTLIAGQQVGFAGGPLYTLAKIASLLKMKRELEARGTSAAAFFWLATEDHDFDEIAQLSVPVNSIDGEGINRQLDLLTVRATRPVDSKSIVGPMPVPEALIAELKALYDLRAESWLREGITFRDSFAELLARTFGSELVLVDSLLPELRRAGGPLFSKIFNGWSAVQQTLRERAGALQQARYAPQIAARENGDYTLLFQIDDHGDRQIMEQPSSVPPERISTSAITRPLLQDFVFQPDVFIGGPAEVAYYAQIEPLHGMLGVPMPRVALRAHVLLAPRRVLKFIDRHAIPPETIFSSPDELLVEKESESIAAIRQEAAQGEKELLQHIERIGELALPADHALARAINRSIGHIEYHFRKLTERAIKGVVRKDRDRFAAARELVGTLYPDGIVQDRIVSWLPFWLRHREVLVQRVVEEAEPDSEVFKVIEL